MPEIPHNSTNQYQEQARYFTPQSFSIFLVHHVYNVHTMYSVHHVHMYVFVFDTHTSARQRGWSIITYISSSIIYNVHDIQPY